MYSASAVDVATTDCFFDCQHIGSLSINKINPDMWIFYPLGHQQNQSRYMQLVPPVLCMLF